MTTEVKEMVESAGKITWLDRSPRRGFSFVEILFAVMILGIGFILIAGIFPVAINQTQANGDETIAATTARSAAAIIANLPNTAAYMAPVAGTTPILRAFGPTGTANEPLLWAELNGAQVLSEDPRYGWVGFYYCGVDAYGNPADTAQITVIAARVRNHDAYTAADQTAASSTLVGKPVTITKVSASTALTTLDQITFGPTNLGAVAPGTFVVISTDPTANTVGSAVGWVLKVGQPVTAGSNVYYLQPGGDMKSSPLYKPNPSATPMSAFIVGQGSDPDNPGTFIGGAQDIMAYTTMIPLH